MDDYAIYSKHIYYQNKFVEGYLTIHHQKFAAFTIHRPDHLPIHSHENDYVLPGIIDVHNHGYMGWSVAAATSRNEVSHYAKCLASAGVTGVLATTRDERALGIVADYIHENVTEGSKILGIHTEGPYFSPDKLGASVYEEHPLPSLAYSRQLWELSKHTIRYVTLAPELDNIASSIRFFQSKNCVISFGHTNATYKEMSDAIAKFSPGVSTHTGNAMRGIDRRDGGALAAVLLDPYMKCELISDLIHISREVIELFFKVKSISDFLLVSDSGELAGMNPGTYVVRSTSVRQVFPDGSIRLPNGTIAGSSKYVLYGVKCLMQALNIPLEKIVPSFSQIPAALLGIHEKGIINHGYDADFFIADSEMNVLSTYVEGSKVYDASFSDLMVNPDLKTVEM